MTDDLTAAEIEAFWDKVEKRQGSCWEWRGAQHGNGYGTFRLRGKKVFAHRFAYELCVGPIPVGKQIDHLCRNKSCVRPLSGDDKNGHIEPVTPRENTLRGTGPSAVNSRKTTCANGHSPMSFKPTRTAGRVCVECKAARSRAWRAKNSSVMRSYARPWAKLTADQAREARALMEAGKSTGSTAGMFGVSFKAMQKIRRGLTWKHI